MKVAVRLLTCGLLLCVVLQVNVGHPSEVDEIFDAISYSKGASVIRMLHNYIGDEVGCVTLLSRSQRCEVSFKDVVIKFWLLLYFLRTLGKEWTPIFWSFNIKMLRQVRTRRRDYPCCNSCVNRFHGFFLTVWLTSVLHRGSMGLSGTGQWVTHRCSDGVVDQADGLPDYSSGPGTGELHWTESFKSPAVFPFNCRAIFRQTFKC